MRFTDETIDFGDHFLVVKSALSLTLAAHSEDIQTEKTAFPTSQPPILRSSSVQYWDEERIELEKDWTSTGAGGVKLVRRFHGP